MVRLAVLFTFFSLIVPSDALGQTPQDEQLANALEPLLLNHDGEIGLAIKSLHSDIHYSFNGDTPMATASLIKLPMMVTAHRMVDEGKLSLDKTIELKREDKVPGSGVLTEHFSNGVSLPLRDYMRLMIRYSDNTATNIVADQIGLRKTAAVMKVLGMPNTKLHSKVYRGDTTVFPKRSQQFGIGSTTANEMVKLLSELEAGKLAAAESTQTMRDHLLACDDGNKIAAGLPSNVKFAHKTGAIASVRTDAGIIYASSGPIAVCFLSNKNKDQTWTDQNAANVLASRVGEIIIERFGAPKADSRLREGAFGEIVESLQRTLNDRLKPTSGLSIDGDFGPATRGAVERFQRENGLEETGIVTNETWKALGTLIEEDEPVPPPAVVNAQELPRIAQASDGDVPAVTCKAFAIADKTGKVLFGSNANTPLEAASTTKIMTAYLVIRYAKENPAVLDEIITFSARADNTVGSTSGVRVGERVSVRQLLYGLMLPSGNDASVAFAEHFGARVSGAAKANDDANASYVDFVKAMNSAAKDLGMDKSNYTNTHGLSNVEHVISAADLVRLTHAAMQFDLFRKVNATRQFGCELRGEQGYRRNVVWKNTNRLLEIQGFSGVKTGTTSAAGACLVAFGERDGDELLAVILGSSSSPARYADAKNLFRWAWAKRK